MSELILTFDGVSTVRTWLRAPDHTLGIALLLLGLFLASSAVAMMLTG